MGRNDVLAAAGAAVFSGGVALIYVPAALIVIGLFVMAWAIFEELG